MIFTQYYLDCLSQASYLIADESTGQAVVVDPRRDIAEYLADAKEKNLTIVGVINTHFHADFVSGHLELARETGAWIGFGEAANPEFEFRALADGESIDLGGVRLEIMATPGHTPESISILVFENADDEVAHAVLTGDALFIGDVGRPDLLASVGMTAEELGKQLYHSVQTKLMGLPDEVRVFPAHGAGSACGKNLSTEKQSTIGEQRRFNYACQPMSEQQFLDVVTEGQPTQPGYFLFNATINKQDRDLLEIDATVPALSDDEVTDALDAGAVLHDARAGDEYAAGYLKGSVSVPADGRMAETAGMVFTPEQRIVIMAPRGGEQEVATRLARIGYDNVVGYIPEPEDYLVRHQDRVEPASRLRLDQLDDVPEGTQLIDIRNPGEVAEGMIDGATHIPLPQLPTRAAELDQSKPVVLYCAGGWRSAVGASFLRSRGFGDVSDLLGGYNAWVAGRAGAH
ncbi:MAG TPA: MBL fold metallo-hydrolase [Propionibacterium sp.]|jgi:glyoxylase-like metal-dependent hydrolase (beta-lactamase superfamily II)|nr:MBL fold metallo-hydrolase [Propionibacterium sp.]